MIMAEAAPHHSDDSISFFHSEFGSQTALAPHINQPQPEGSQRMSERWSEGRSVSASSPMSRPQTTAKVK